MNLPFFKKKAEFRPKLDPVPEPEHPREEALRRYWREIERLESIKIARGR